MYSNMYFYYVNINGLNKKKDRLNMIISKHSSHIVCLVETTLFRNVKVNIPGCYLFKKSKNALSGGTVIAVKEKKIFHLNVLKRLKLRVIGYCYLELTHKTL